MTNQDLITENKKRLAEFTQPYDPELGIGSKVPRFEYTISTSDPEKRETTYHLPNSLKNDPIFKAIKEDAFKDIPEVTPEIILAAIEKLRIKHDFEYWAFIAIKIKDKKSGDYIKFRQNRAQRRYIAKLEEERNKRVPIRIILLKARQWGGSTATQFYAFWLQNIHHQNWNSVIVTEVEQQAANILDMYDNAALEYPGHVGEITLTNFRNSSKNKQVKESGSVIYLGSLERPNSLRSGDYKIAHLSEVGLWKETKGKKPGDIVQTLIGSIPLLSDTLVVLESTAKGVGNYFHKTYTSASQGKNIYTTVFVPWFEFEDYMMDVPEDDYYNFFQTLTEYEKGLWRQGATLEGIHWYRWKLAELDHDVWSMRSEFPSNEQEAFQSTGSRVFPIDYVERNRHTVEDPIFTGEWISDATNGPNTLKNIHWHNDPAGNTQMWLEPDTTQKVKHRYLVIVDIGGTTKDSDWSEIKVIDRYWRMKGGKDETALVCRLHQDVDIVAWKAVRIAKIYNDALLVVEKNSLNRKKDAGENYYATLEEIADHYKNVYKRTEKEDEEREGKQQKYGFHTNKLTKPMMVSLFKSALRDQLRNIRDANTLNEADTYEENKQTGEYAAVEGNHDDSLVTEMIGHYISHYVMPLPSIVQPPKPKPKRKKRDIDI